MTVVGASVGTADSTGAAYTAKGGRTAVSPAGGQTGVPTGVIRFAASGKGDRLLAAPAMSNPENYDPHARMAGTAEICEHGTRGRRT
jgi:hypothetical protein